MEFKAQYIEHRKQLIQSERALIRLNRVDETNGAPGQVGQIYLAQAERLPPFSNHRANGLCMIVHICASLRLNEPDFNPILFVRAYLVWFSVDRPPLALWFDRSCM